MREDIKENEMSGGVPVRMRGIDADGNSITPTMEEVTDALPGEQKYDRGVYYSLPKSIVSVHHGAWSMAWRSDRQRNSIRDSRAFAEEQ